MEQHLPTLEVCKKLRGAGFVQESEYAWYLCKEAPHSPQICRTRDWDHHMDEYYETYAAPLLTEILEQLPTKTKATGGTLGSRLQLQKLSVFREKPPTYQVGYGHVRPFAIQVGHSNPAEAAALLWLELNAR